jgi:hypothetical protein
VSVILYILLNITWAYLAYENKTNQFRNTCLLCLWFSEEHKSLTNFYLKTKHIPVNNLNVISTIFTGHLFQLDVIVILKTGAFSYCAVVLVSVLGLHNFSL